MYLNIYISYLSSVFTTSRVGPLGLRRFASARHVVGVDHLCVDVGAHRCGRPHLPGPGRRRRWMATIWVYK